MAGFLVSGFWTPRNQKPGNKIAPGASAPDVVVRRLNPPGLRGNGYASTLITTRRFWARPALVLFGATGFSLP
jgi:hypothetical protein